MIKLTLGDKEETYEESEIKEIIRDMGNVEYLSDICGFYLKCPDCQGKDIGCGKRFVSAKVVTPPGFVEVTFKNGGIGFYDKIEYLRG